MKSIQNVAEEREPKACPTANNADDIFKAARKTGGFESGEESKSEIPQQSKDKAHCFCPILAKEHGEEAAVIFQWFGWKVARSKKVHKGRKWHYDTLEALEKRWPYLRDSGIHGILQRQAEKQNVFKDRFNTMHWIDRTTWYSVTEELVKRAMEKEGKVWFDVPVAVQCHSIIAGTIYQNVRYHLLKFLADNPEFIGVPYHKVNKAALARVLPWSLSTINRHFDELVTNGCVAVNPNCSKEYTICNKADLVVPDAMNNNASKSVSSAEKNVSSAEMGIVSSMERIMSSTEQIVSSTEKNVSSTENNTHCKPFEKHIHKHHSPNAAREVRGVCSDAAGAADASKHENTFDNTGSSTVPVKEHGVMPAIEDGISYKAFQSIRDIGKVTTALKAKFSESELINIADESVGVAATYCHDKIAFEELVTAWNAKTEAEIIAAIAMGVRKCANDNADKFGLTDKVLELTFVEGLELAAEVFRLVHSESRLMQPQFKGRGHWITYIYDGLKAPNERSNASAPAKADLLIEEIRRSSREGWPSLTCGEVPFTVSGSNRVRKAATAFFETNSHLCVDDVWVTLKNCVLVHEKNVVPQGRDPFWYARRGVDALFLFKFWEDIKAQIDAAETLTS